MTDVTRKLVQTVALRLGLDCGTDFQKFTRSRAAQPSPSVHQSLRRLVSVPLVHVVTGPF